MRDWHYWGHKMFKPRTLCSKTVYPSEDAAENAAKARGEYGLAHICPICGNWHAGVYPTRCPTGKVGHSGREEAEAHAAKLNAKPDGNGMNETYQCNICGQWHNGRPRGEGWRTSRQKITSSR